MRRSGHYFWIGVRCTEVSGNTSAHFGAVCLNLLFVRSPHVRALSYRVALNVYVSHYGTCHSVSHTMDTDARNLDITLYCYWCDGQRMHRSVFNTGYSWFHYCYECGKEWNNSLSWERVLVRREIKKRQKLRLLW